MTDFLGKVGFFTDVARRIVRGEKIDRHAYDPHLIQELESIAARMYTGFFTVYEPQALIIQEGWSDKEIGFMGLSTLHPLTTPLLKEAKSITAEETDFFVYGALAQGRTENTERKNKPAVLAKGDFVSLLQVMDDITHRLQHSNPSELPPIIIQNPEYWGGIFKDNEFDFSRIGVTFTRNTKDTYRVLAEQSTKHPAVTEDQGSLSSYRLNNPVNVFATTDHIKHIQVSVAQAQRNGELRVAHTVVEPYQIPEEQQYSYPGNAWVKMVNIMEVALKRDLRDSGGQQINLMVNDGGLAVFLMNKRGQRAIDIYTDEVFFPTSAHVMNQVLSGPGVELAELYKSSPNFDSVVDATYRKVDTVCKTDPRFKPSDLRVFDTTVQMCIPLAEFRRLYDEYSLKNPARGRRDICEDIARHHTVCVADVQSTKLLRHPRIAGNPLSHDTTHFLEASGCAGRSRAEIPEWIEDSPNVRTFHMMMDAMDVPTAAVNAARTMEHRRNPKIAVPGMLFGSRANTSATRLLKEELKEFGINWRLGTEYWRRFNIAAASGITNQFSDAAYLHRKHVRDVLAEHDFLYIPRDCAPTSLRERLEYLLLVSSAMVQRQVFKKDAPFIIMERGPFADDVIMMFSALKNMGLIGQQFDHLVTLTDTPAQSARAIDGIMHMIPATIRPHVPSKDRQQINMPDNMTVVAYCSAGNKNKQWLPDAILVGRHLAMNHIDLKLGGGKDGMMKAVADGYMAGLDELIKRGETPRGRMHLIQCKDTQTLEGNYEIPPAYAHLQNYVVSRCYDTIEERRYDLQKSHMPIVLAGGVGTFEEILCELIAVHAGEKDVDDFTMRVLSQTGIKPDKTEGRVYDFLNTFLKKCGMAHGLVQVVRTPDETLHIITDKKREFDTRKPQSQGVAINSTVGFSVPYPV